MVQQVILQDLHTKYWQEKYEGVKCSRITKCVLYKIMLTKHQIIHSIMINQLINNRFY